MSWWPYCIQLVALVLSAMWLYRTMRKAGQLNTSIKVHEVRVFTGSLCANMSETSSPSTITVVRGKKSHFDKSE